jgi:uncharacterized protein
LATLTQAAERACDRITPSWPLDRFIAVNPFWSWTDHPLSEAVGELAALSGASLLMPRAWYAEEWRAGRLRAAHLREAIAQSKAHITEKHLSALLWIDEPALHRRPLVVDVLDSRDPLELDQTWREYVLERVSRFCAGYFDEAVTDSPDGLYASWREFAQWDWGPALLMGLYGYRSAVAALPATASQMLALAMSELRVPESETDRYLSSLLLDVNGWASWCAYLRWTERLSGRDDEHLVELLAVRAAWDWILFRTASDELRAAWRHAVSSWPTFDLVAHAARAEDWLLQRAVELAYSSDLIERLPANFSAPRPDNATVQAVFCLDVRSEVFRRALEAQSQHIHTLGCAGFFGLPVEYAPLAADHARPQLPGLMAPSYRVTDTGVPASLAATRTTRLAAAYAEKAFKSSPLSMFAYVDAMGFSYGKALLDEAVGRSVHGDDHHENVGLSAAESRMRVPQLTSRVDGTPITDEERCALAENVLRMMSLTRGFARVVLLVGHRASARNNPYAAALDCGACCGQSGEVNARAAAALLNDEKVRADLVARGIEIPASTQFVAALHNTTTDDVTMFHDATPVHGDDLLMVRGMLDRASVATRRERAPRLGLADLADEALHAAVRERGRNWAEVRPEWALAGNAAFLVAPRERSRSLDLQGRVFLHEYRVEDDPDAVLLEQIMTGPMIVTHWINFQYYASMVDNPRYGSGNKLLHNVVGGHLGVFEGNGGDLRIGLSIQSLHDGERWMHAPLRLAVLIEAPSAAIDGVLEKHAKLRQLVDNEWLHLFQIDAAGRTILARRAGEWVAPSSASR